MKNVKRRSKREYNSKTFITKLTTNATHRQHQQQNNQAIEINFRKNFFILITKLEMLLPLPLPLPLQASKQNNKWFATCGAIYVKTFRIFKYVIKTTTSNGAYYSNLFQQQPTSALLNSSNCPLKVCNAIKNFVNVARNICYLKCVVNRGGLWTLLPFAALKLIVSV